MESQYQDEGLQRQQLAQAIQATQPYRESTSQSWVRMVKENWLLSLIILAALVWLVWWLMNKKSGPKTVDVTVTPSGTGATIASNSFKVHRYRMA